MITYIWTVQCITVEIQNFQRVHKHDWETDKCFSCVNGHTDTPFIFGKYRVVSDKPTDDKRYRNVTAYDAIYDIGESEVSSWYNGLKFPLTLKQFRDSFFSYFGVEQ